MEPGSFSENLLLCELERINITLELFCVGEKRLAFATYAGRFSLAWSLASCLHVQLDGLDGRIESVLAPALGN
jgi:hypothetical protein